MKGASGVCVERDGYDEEWTWELERSGGSVPYTDRATDHGDGGPTVELVREDRALLAAEPTPVWDNPVSAYLAGLADSSRRPIRANCETVARLVSGGRVAATELAWWNLRYEHTSLIRSTLAASYAPATANLMFSAVRGVLKACFRLGYMTADDLQRASDLPARSRQPTPTRPRRGAGGVLRPLPFMLKITRRRGAPGTRRSSPCSTRAASGGARRSPWTSKTTTPRPSRSGCAGRGTRSGWSTPRAGPTGR